MENASKALLMAGGVLITLLIVTIGVYFARNMADQNARIYAQMEQSKRTEFNQQFLKYDGNTDITIQDIATLINLARDSNERNGLTGTDAPSSPATDNSLYVTVSVNTSDAIMTNENAEQIGTDDLAKFLNEKIGISKKYTCEIITNSNTGYVNHIKIY